MMNQSIINNESINNHKAYAHPQYKTAQHRLRKDSPLTTEDIAAMQGASLYPHAESKEKNMLQHAGSNTPALSAGRLTSNFFLLFILHDSFWLQHASWKRTNPRWSSWASQAILRLLKKHESYHLLQKLAVCR